MSVVSLAYESESDIWITNQEVWFLHRKLELKQKASSQRNTARARQV